MAGKQAKQKSRAKTKSRKRNARLSDLPVAASGAVKGGDTKSTTTSTSSTYMNFDDVKGETTTDGFEKWIQ